MLHLLAGRTRFWQKGTAIVLVAGLLAAPLPAADAEKDTSLKLVPADVAFYSASLRNREQFEAILHSNAWARLRDLPAVQFGWKKLLEEAGKPGGPLEQFNAFRSIPENQQLLEVLADMLANEVFFYGAESSLSILDLFQTLNSTNMMAGLSQISAGNKKSNPEQQVKEMLKALNENPDLIRVPDLVVGFKLTKTEPAQAQIKRLEALLKEHVDQVPQMKGRVRTARVAGQPFLTLNLDGKMVPWDKVDLSKFENTPGQYDKLVTKLKALTLTLSLGVRDNYLLFTIGASTAPAARFGNGKGLGTRPEFQRLEKFADKPITDINYVSKSTMTHLRGDQSYFTTLAAKAREYLKTANLPDELRKRIEADINEASKDMQAYVHEAGAQLSFAFTTPTGQESYSYDWSEYPDLDGSKPLTLLHHVGGSPLFAVLTRTKYKPENYARLVKWLKKLNGYVEEYVNTQDDDVKTKYKQITDIAFPLLERVDKATGQMLLPALADGQSAFVFDAKLKSKQWFAGMPEAQKELPLPEIAFVFGVSDAELLKKAFVEYRSIINDALQIATNATGGLFGKLELPPPDTREAKAGTIYYYPLPNQLIGLDPRIVPNAGLSKRVADLALTVEESERLLANRPLKAKGTLLADLKRPLAGAAYCDWAGIVDVMAPWVEYGLRQAIPDEGNPTPFDKESIIKQVRTALDVLKVIRTYSSITYFDGQVLVTHSETVIEDVK